MADNYPKALTILWKSYKDCAYGNIAFFLIMVLYEVPVQVIKLSASS